MSSIRQLLEIKVKKLYLDREFFCISVIRRLQILNIPLIFPELKEEEREELNSYFREERAIKQAITMSNSQGDSVTFDL